MARAVWLADVLRAAGLTVVEDGGWKARGRDAFYPRGVVVHATAGGTSQGNSSAWSVLVNGREGLAGPISQVMLERGTHRWRPVASGASNHVKVGWAGPHRGFGNRELLGIEWHHNNLDEPVTEQALEVYARGVAAICRHLDLGVDRVVLHKEHQPGEKTDTIFDANAFRARVARHLNGTAEDDMSWDDVTAIQGGATSAGWQSETAPSWARSYGAYNLRSVEERITAKLEALAAQPPVQPTPIDVATLKAALLDPEVRAVLVDAARQGADAAEDS